MHDPVSGTIAIAKKEELLLEIKHQRDLGNAGLLEEDKYLAKVNLEEMATSLGERQHYWLLTGHSNCTEPLCIKGAMEFPTNGAMQYHRRGGQV